MTDLIDRQALLRDIEKYHLSDGKFQHWVEVQPSVEAEPVRHGRWMLYKNQNQDDVNNGNYLYVCSNCKHSDIHARTVNVPYCWHCGALMDEVAQ